MNQLAFLRFNFALNLAHAQQRLEFLFRYRFETRGFARRCDPARERMDHIRHEGERPRGDSRHTARETEREGLGRDVAEEQHDHEHQRHGGVRAGRPAEPCDQESGREAFGEDIGTLVKADYHDERLERARHQAIERVLDRTFELRTRVLHPDQGKKGGLGRGQEGAQQHQHRNGN